MERTFVLSKYCYFFKTRSNVCLGYSSRTNALIELSGNNYDYLTSLREKSSHIDIECLEEDSLGILTDNGFLVDSDSDSDYLNESQFITQAAQYDTSKLSLILVPTLNCNFDCPYCFEKNKRAQRMSPSVVEDIVKFVGEHPGKGNIDLKWYGGEPLLGLDIISSMLKMLESSESVNITCHSIITNGYLFDEKAISLFKKYPLDTIQITLDGEKPRHDRMRAMKGSGKPTFDKIVSNLKRILVELPNTQVHVRVNVDKTNINDYYRLKVYLESVAENGNLTVYPGIIRLENEANTNLVEPSFSRWETAELLFDLYSSGMLEGDIYPVRKHAKTCCAMCVSSFIIGPSGEIYKCWNDVSDPSKVIGHIHKDQISNPSIFQRYHTGCAWYNDKDCRDCFYLPICNGKCAWYEERNLYHNGSYNLCQCLQKAPGMLERCLETWYNIASSEKV